MSFRIAPLQAKDALPYRALMLHAYTHAADAFTSTTQERAVEPEAWWARRIADPSGMTVGFGAFEGADLVGTVALEFSEKPKTCHKALVIGMYVLPASRGHGVARALMQAAIDHCRVRGGVLVMQLTVTEGNAPAENLYDSMGFRRFGVETMAIKTPEGFRSKLHMALTLAGQGSPVHPGTRHIQLDHLMVPCLDRLAASQRLASILDVPWAASTAGPFCSVYVSPDLTVDFDQVAPADLRTAHCCFRLTDQEFDALLGRLDALQVAYRSLPHGPVDMQVNTEHAGRIVYWSEPDGHVWEALTVSYARPARLDRNDARPGACLTDAAVQGLTQ